MNTFNINTLEELLEGEILFKLILNGQIEDINKIIINEECHLSESQGQELFDMIGDFGIVIQYKSRKNNKTWYFNTSRNWYLE